MKHLWVILFVTPLFAQFSFCKNPKLIEFLKKAENSGVENLSDEDFEDYVSIKRKLKKCKKNYELDKERAEFERRHQELIEKKLQEEMRLEEEERYAREKYYESLKKKEEDKKSQERQIMFLEGLYNSFVRDKSSNPFNGKSSGRTCQYDGYELRKTFESKIESGKIAYKWKCARMGEHTYWIVE